MPHRDANIIQKLQMDKLQNRNSTIRSQLFKYRIIRIIQSNSDFNTSKGIFVKYNSMKFLKIVHIELDTKIKVNFSFTVTQ